MISPRCEFLATPFFLELSLLFVLISSGHPSPRKPQRLAASWTLWLQPRFHGIQPDKTIKHNPSRTRYLVFVSLLFFCFIR